MSTPSNTTTTVSFAGDGYTSIELFLEREDGADDATATGPAGPSPDPPWPWTTRAGPAPTVTKPRPFVCS